jgi:hypothetical protein
MRGCHPPRAAYAARAGANKPACGSSSTASRGAAAVDVNQASTVLATRGQNPLSTEPL